MDGFVAFFLQAVSRDLLARNFVGFTSLLDQNLFSEMACNDSSICFKPSDLNARYFSTHVPGLINRYDSSESCIPNTISPEIFDTENLL
jgi:hypothetical protein